MEFDWDDNKNAINKRKHGVDFRDAVQVFSMIMQYHLKITANITMKKECVLSEEA